MNQVQAFRASVHARQAANCDDDLGRERTAARAAWWVGELSHELGIVDAHGMIDTHGETARSFSRLYLAAGRVPWPADTGRGRFHHSAT